MSQKTLKKLRRLENVSSTPGMVSEPVKGIWQIIKENWKFLLILCVGIVVLYFNGMHGDFVSDDYASIPDNAGIMSFSNQTKGLIGGLINW